MPGITLDDIFGPNVTNILLIAGILFSISPIRQIQKKTLRHLMPLLVIAANNSVAFIGSSKGTRYSRIGLLAFFSFYIYKSLRSRNAKADTDTISNKDPLLAKPKGISLSAKQFLLFAVEITLLS
jgi:Ca2+/Na+ antiporter